jgi:Kef-type K+ transport system membrane component KefB
MSGDLSRPRPKRLPGMLGYALMLGLAVGAFLLIRAYGETLPASQAGGPARPSARHTPHADVVLHVLLALAAVVAAGQALGRLCAYLGQPPVIGEVVGGILLGPSLLGRLWPEAYAFLLPPAVVPFLEVIAQLGVVLYMFLVGLELNPGLLRARGHATVAIAHASIACPFVLGAALALALYPDLAAGGVAFTPFALFLGVAMSITAFPVLARILTDRRLSRTELGVVALACAALGDVTAWCLLALVVGVAQAHLGGALWTAALALGYIAFMFLVARPAVHWLVARYDRGSLSRGVLALVFVGLLLSSLATEFIGIHAIFGAFLFGAVIPHDSSIAREVARGLEDLATVLLLPAFFALTGMRTEFGLLSGAGDLLAFALILVVATAGKFGGTLGAARLAGLGWETSAALGVLMNTRGLMELIVLHVGLELGVLSPALFALMVLMALATTAATGPALHLLPHVRPADDTPAGPP